MRVRSKWTSVGVGIASQVYREMLWNNAQWRLDVDVANVTAAYAGINVAGPRARDTLRNRERGDR